MEILPPASLADSAENTSHLVDADGGSVRSRDVTLVGSTSRGSSLASERRNAWATRRTNESHACEMRKFRPSSMLSSLSSFASIAIILLRQIRQSHQPNTMIGSSARRLTSFRGILELTALGARERKRREEARLRRHCGIHRHHRSRRWMTPRVETRNDAGWREMVAVGRVVSARARAAAAGNGSPLSSPHGEQKWVFPSPARHESNSRHLAGMVLTDPLDRPRGRLRVRGPALVMGGGGGRSIALCKIRLTACTLGYLPP